LTDVPPVGEDGGVKARILDNLWLFRQGDSAAAADGDAATADLGEEKPIIWELSDLETATCTGVYESFPDALAVVMAALDRGGIAAVKRLTLTAVLPTGRREAKIDGEVLLHVVGDFVRAPSPWKERLTLG
jgi:hypothetical protein